MRINSISLNFNKPQAKQNISFGNYDRKYSWCQDNPLISKDHPAIYSYENEKFDNLEEIEDIMLQKEYAKHLKRTIETLIFYNPDITDKQIADRIFRGKIEVSKTQDNKVQSCTLTSMNGEKTTIKFDEFGKLAFIAKGIETKGTRSKIEEFYCFRNQSIATKYCNFLAIGNACAFDKGFESWDGSGYAIANDCDKNIQIAINAFKKYQTM